MSDARAAMATMIAVEETVRRMAEKFYLDAERLTAPFPSNPPDNVRDAIADAGNSMKATARAVERVAEEMQISREAEFGKPTL